MLTIPLPLSLVYFRTVPLITAFPCNYSACANDTERLPPFFLCLRTASRMSQRSRKVPTEGGVLSVNSGSGLAIWNELQIQQENWGGNLGLPAREPGAVVELASTEGKIVVSTDPEQRNIFKECILGLSGSVGDITCTDFEVNWKRPVEIFAPFRPLVHRNVTPFFDPYDTQRVIGSRVPAMTSPSRRADSKSSAAAIPLHIQFPEIVTTAEFPTPEAPATESLAFSEEGVVGQYRKVQPLTQAYDVGLELGCAATPAEACGSRYSTGLRRRLNQADAISRLSEPPPFVMDAFNTAIRFVESEQNILTKGNYLWELIHPHAPGTCHPVYNPYGKYVVRLFIDGYFRQVPIDDYLPVDALGRPFFSVTAQKEIWPALIAKALFVALGPNRHLLFTDSEAIIACLLGEWVPQRINPRTQPATACALLLNARKDQLYNDSDATHFSASQVLTPDEDKGVSVSTQEQCNTSPWVDNQINERPASQSKRASRLEASFANGANSPLSYDISVTNVPAVPETPVICAVGVLPHDMRKLYVIHKVVVFRDTLALKISTNPPSSIIEPKELTLDNKDEAVQGLLHHPSCGDLDQRGTGWAASQESAVASSAFWVTFEELAESLDIIIWRQLGQESPFTFNSRITYTDTSSHPRKKGAASAAAAATTVARQTVVRWMHISSKAPEQIAIVNLGGSASCRAASAVIGSPTPSLLAAAHQTPALSMMGSESSQLKALSGEGREVHLDLYRWDRGDVLCRAASFACEPSRLECMLHTVPAGSHVFRVTVVGLEPQEVVGLFSTRNFILGDEKEALRSANIFKMSDAGAHPGVEKPNEEVIWFKHRFAVKEPTIVSFVLSTLESGEELSMYRDMPGASGKESKGVKTRNTNVRLHSKEAAEGSPPRGAHAEIIPYCNVLLVDLDAGTSKRGAVGHLVRQRIEPNQRGYLVMAYALVEADSISFSLKPADLCADSPLEYGSPREKETNGLSPCGDKGPLTPFGVRPHLFSKGWWRLVVLSSVPLDSYRAIPKDTWSFAEKGQLKQGSNALLFSYACTVSDRTDITLLLDVHSQRPIPFHIKIFRAGVEGPPVFVSEECVNHLFVPHVAVDVPEKVKNVAYIIEAWLDKEKVEEWERMRRLSQELKFLLAAEAARVKAEMKQQKELQEYHEDPRAFKERLLNQEMGPVENLVPTPLREQMSVSSKKGRPSVDKRRTLSNAAPSRQTIVRTSVTPSTPASAVAVHIDSIDPELVVTYDLRLYFSAKTDVKCVATGKDPLTTMRGLWVPPIDPLFGEAPPLSGGRSGGQRGKQKDSSPSPEELYKADQGRLSRQNFLENPRNLLFPYLPQGEKIRGVEESAPNALASTPSIALVVGVEDEPNFLHAPILDESAHRVQHFSLYATEVVPPTHGSPTQSASGVPFLRTRSPNGRIAAPTFGNNPPPTDDDALAIELKTPVNEVCLWLGEELRRQEERRAECRNGIKTLMREYWETRKPGAAVLALPHAREDEGNKRPRPRSKMSS
ncbi:calpain-like cysteine peptidase, putative [Trypanosoma brucei gambiense DAL972]|uniref:Calpain-like cysteine peptidase, putative n=1 Tax=Trypanosoma brucei gambiense (strain MHOM/CI/86/DAL972) TaxID=679716 RepID=D0A9W8_TRYB9|nr:calpain-like cysteine peptidase, putative [Trypanosoma brucei gambiense DAL972]CBH18469.1 calpain-like cysteine peptidase, putative [Trypanosoma brucei gambiense DAL972]|eukprot:XP_011780733.1 calpain-like cysteine peptidase, putative [Trypanosoma brucei gambiense DAL972]